MTPVNDTAADPKRKRPALSPEEADRFAAKIKPSWELDAEALAAGNAAIGAGAGEDPADTLIEGMPTVDVPGVPISSRSQALAPPPPVTAPRPAAAVPYAPPQKTKLGMGLDGDAPADSPPAQVADEPTEVLDPATATTPLPVAAASPAAQVAAPEARAASASATPAIGTPAPASARKSGAARQTEPRPRASAHGGGSAGKAQTTGESDSIDLPIAKSGGMIVKVLIGAAALVGIIVAVKVLGGSSDPTPAPTSTVAAPTSRPEPTPAATTKATAPVVTAPPATAAPQATSAAPETSAAPSAKPTATPATPKTADPVATTPPTKPPSTGGTTKPPPAGGGTKKPPTGGGIIRETPF